MIPNVGVDTCNDDEMNAQLDSSNQAETSKMTPDEWWVYMHRSTNNIGEVLCSGKLDSKTLKNMIDSIRDERSTNKKYQNEDSSKQVVSKR